MGEFVRFQSTLWSRIRLVQKHDSRAVAEFVERYRPPVVLFIRNAGFAEADAEDLAQEVFTRLLTADVLHKAEQDRGRFRSFLLAVTRNVMQEERRKRGAAKRGGDQAALSLDRDPIPEPAAPGTEAEAFDRAWLGHLLATALEALEREHPDYHRALEGHLLKGKEYKEIVAEMGKSLQDVKNYIHRGRQKLTELLQREVSRYASSTEEYDEEIRTLGKFLAP